MPALDTGVYRRIANNARDLCLRTDSGALARTAIKSTPRRSVLHKHVEEFNAETDIVAGESKAAIAKDGINIDLSRFAIIEKAAKAIQDLTKYHNHFTSNRSAKTTDENLESVRKAVMKLWNNLKTVVSSTELIGE